MFNRIRLHIGRIDWLLLLAVGALLLMGLATIWSVTLARDPGDLGVIKRQLIAAAIGCGLLFILAASNYRLLKNYSFVLYVVAIVLLIAVLIFGQTVRGTTGWLRFAGWNFQPVEFAKIALIVFLANYLANHPRAAFGAGEFVVSTICVGLMVFLVLLEPDLGSALVLVAIWIGLLAFARIKKRFILLLFGIAAIIAVTSWFFFAPYQKDRILTFIDPSRDPLGRGYNVTQAMVAVGAGEMFGRGLGFGSQSQLRFLPESQTDFIFAVIAEDFGFVGVTVMLVFLGLLVWRMLVIVKHAPDDFTAFLILGILVVFATQGIVNIGMNLGVLPVTGITLPLLSYGGSSLLMFLIMIGITQSVAVRISFARSLAMREF
ncbi:MAG: rod shape-determining protein RodA [bacterium]|nr:rod shape-determining protein RodA [bacterium]